jgi:hypothetical protein
VLVDGWRITHHVFQGNWRDARTVPQVLADLEARFGLRRVVFVGDRGMVTSDNLAMALVQARQHGYVVGAEPPPPGRRLPVHRARDGAVGGLPGRDHGPGEGGPAEDPRPGSARRSARGPGVRRAQ